MIAGMAVLRVVHPCELGNCFCEWTKLPFCWVPGVEKPRCFECVKPVARWIEPRARWGLFYSKMQPLPAPPSPEGGVKPLTDAERFRSRLSHDIKSRICSKYCEIPNCPYWCAESPLLSGHGCRCAVHRDMSTTMRRARLALAHSSLGSAAATSPSTKTADDEAVR